MSDECTCDYPGTGPARCRCSARWDEPCDFCDWLQDHDCPDGDTD